LSFIGGDFGGVVTFSGAHEIAAHSEARIRLFFELRWVPLRTPSGLLQQKKMARAGTRAINQKR
jgi:hypothetical protein